MKTDEINENEIVFSRLLDDVPVTCMFCIKRVSVYIYNCFCFLSPFSLEKKKTERQNNTSVFELLLIA